MYRKRSFETRVLTRFVQKYAPRVAHFELDGVNLGFAVEDDVLSSAEHTHEGDWVGEIQSIVMAPQQGDLASIGLEKAGIANQTDARDVGVGDRHGFCQEQTLVIVGQFDSMEYNAFHVPYLSDKTPEAAFHGQAVKTVAYLRVSTVQQDLCNQRYHASGAGGTTAARKGASRA